MNNDQHLFMISPFLIPLIEFIIIGNPKNEETNPVSYIIPSIYDCHCRISRALFISSY